jgi:serine/threonine-protein kinase RsbW
MSTTSTLTLQLDIPTRPESLMNEPPERLELDSRLADLSRVSPWIEALAKQFEVREETQFALCLCIEEALANVVLHGYRNEPGHPIIIRSCFAEGTLFVTIEDQAPPFSPPEEVLPIAGNQQISLDSIEAGGNGIRLLRHFAGTLAYERTSDGNRLTIGFPLRQK